jgi:ABC-type transporter Mla maintaining outer membrane lipid asymmetry ATPase subunit MlaF
MNEPMIQLEYLHISYGRAAAVRGLSLDIARGEILGCWGQTARAVQHAGVHPGAARADGRRRARGRLRCLARRGADRRFCVQLQHAALFPS